MQIHNSVSSLFYFFNLQQIADLGDLATGLGIVGLNGLVADLPQAQGLSGGDVLLQTAIQALDELNI